MGGGLPLLNFFPNFSRLTPFINYSPLSAHSTSHTISKVSSANVAGIINSTGSNTQRNNTETISGDISRRYLFFLLMFLVYVLYAYESRARKYYMREKSFLGNFFLPKIRLDLYYEPCIIRVWVIIHLTAETKTVLLADKSDARLVRPN